MKMLARWFFKGTVILAGPFGNSAIALTGEIRFVFFENSPEPVAHLTVVEDAIFQQDLPHANSLSPGVNTGRLLYHPVYQLSPDTALSKGDETQRVGKPYFCREREERGWKRIFKTRTFQRLWQHKRNPRQGKHYRVYSLRPLPLSRVMWIK